jgi:hypothetical protein
MKQIPLTQGKFTLVDDDVYEWASQYKWHVLKGKRTFYVVRNLTKREKLQDENKTIYIHHVVIGYPLNGLMVDHKDGNGLNNQRNNLRFVTNRKNSQNQIDHREGKLVGGCLVKVKYDGVIYFYWKSLIRINGKQKLLGYFLTEQEAHDAYMKALKRLI